MGSSSKRARRTQRAQESLGRGASSPEQERDSNMDSEVNMEGDQEVLFPPKKRDDVIIPPTTQKVLEVPDCTVGSVTSWVITFIWTTVEIIKVPFVPVFCPLLGTCGRQRRSSV